MFDLFLALGYSSFHLARAEGTLVQGGTRLFSGLNDTTPEQLLASHGLKKDATYWLDEAARVSMTVWRTG